ncbi:DUF4179 domain-containing protein [Lysinibacillus agricola]|uniref:DUF4179 domain-containing protein n=1 Tax=Lysinibacillus agricola TaxID=2590012 RepID=A0ABX7APW2_9BACI|nr:MULTISPECIES: DUF4179 domain-containing protein [Lysinibacillus]KOS60481.1 hypothetical protein AN161_23115 [Lysinibacillus sp. FJAT-14222]QQP10279.1 DUF4179 domain-containing protein [Lysinibacillus agricola]
MKKNVEERILQEMNKEQELPQSIRMAFDQSYELINQQSKKKTRLSWLKAISAAVATIALTSSVLLTNDSALATLKAFFGFDDPGLEVAGDNGDVQYVGQTQQSENITIALEHLFADAYRLGLQLNIQSENIEMDNLYYMSVEYRLYNAQGVEIDALVSDTKTIEGPGMYTGYQFQLENIKNNATTLEMLAESTTTAVPPLDGAKLVIEEVHFVNKEGGIISVDGEWAFDLQPATVETQVFVAQNEVTGLELQQAMLSNGSMYISFTINRNIEDENYIFDTALLTSNNEAFYANGANVERTNEYTTINLVFPYSIWNEQQSLSLAVKGYEKLRLVKKE